MSNLNNQINQIGQQLRAESAENALTQARSDLYNEQMRNISKSRRSSGNLGDALTIIDLKAQIKDKDNLIDEWMLSNEAYKRLAKNYGTKLGMSDEQQKQDRAEMVLDVSKEHPDYEKTQLAKNVSARLNKLNTPG